MTAVGPAPGTISTDPIVARNFFLLFQKDSEKMVLQSISSLNVEMTPVSTTQNGAGGKIEHIKTVGSNVNVPEVEMVRMAPRDSKNDKIWNWYRDIHTNGFKDRKDKRELITLQLFDPGGTKVGEFELHGAWPCKIVTDALSTDSNDPLKETITFVCEWIDRTK